MEPSVIGKRLRQEEIERQILERGRVYPELTPEYYKEFCGILLDVGNSPHLTSLKVYGTYGKDFCSWGETEFIAQKGMGTRLPPDQLSAHVSVMNMAWPAGDFYGTPVVGLNLGPELVSWENDTVSVRIKYAKDYDKLNGPCPPLEEMLDLIKGVEEICLDNEVRRVTNVEGTKYSTYHDDKAQRQGKHTVADHNVLVEKLGKSLNAKEAKELTDAGEMILWNPEALWDTDKHGKSYIVDFGTQGAV